MFLALETMAVGASAMLGLANPFGVEIEPDAMLPPLATLVVLSATALIFITDAHWEVLRGLVASLPRHSDGRRLRPRLFAQAGCRHARRIIPHRAARSCRRFFLYAITVNLAMSLISRLTPQIAIFYVATPVHRRRRACCCSISPPDLCSANSWRRSPPGWRLAER